MELKLLNQTVETQSYTDKYSDYMSLTQGLVLCLGVKTPPTWFCVTSVYRWAEPFCNFS